MQTAIFNVTPLDVSDRRALISRNFMRAPRSYRGAYANVHIQALTNATKCNICDCQRRFDNLLRNGVIPLNRNTHNNEQISRGVKQTRDRIMNCYNAVVIYGSVGNVIYLFNIPRILLNIKYFTWSQLLRVLVAQHNSLANFEDNFKSRWLCW